MKSPLLARMQQAIVHRLHESGVFTIPTDIAVYYYVRLLYRVTGRGHQPSAYWFSISHCFHLFG